MKTEEMKTVVETLDELNESYGDLLNAVKGTIREMKTTRKLWHNGNKSRLIKIGLALIAFPEPTPISETVGACFIAAGTIQKAIRNRTIYIEDISLTFHNTLKEVWMAKHDLRI